jgi:hypothetical protein
MQTQSGGQVGHLSAVARRMAMSASALQHSHSGGPRTPMTLSLMATKVTGMVEPPYEHDLNLVMQTVATIVLWAGTAVALGLAVLKARRETTILPVVLIVAVAVGSILEPIYDTTYHLLWYTGGFVGGSITGHQWTLFTAFGLPQPVWVMPAYVMVFGLPALIMYDRLAKKPNAATIVKMAGTLF